MFVDSTVEAEAPGADGVTNERRLDQRVREAIAVWCGFLDETSAGSRLEDVHDGGLRGARCREKRLEVKVATYDRGRCEYFPCGIAQQPEPLTQHLLDAVWDLERVDR